MSLIETPALDDSLHPPIESLVVAAQREEARPTRSRLEPCAQIIFILREKRWSFAAITAWLAQNGVQVAESKRVPLWSHHEDGNATVSVADLAHLA